MAGRNSRPWARVGCYRLSYYLESRSPPPPPPPPDQLRHLLLATTICRQIQIFPTAEIQYPIESQITPPQKLVFSLKALLYLMTGNHPVEL